MSSERSYVGLTWDHPRGYVALERAAELARAEGLQIRWERQPLEGFESHPIEELAAAYDIIVLDHPHLGDAVEGNCLQALEDVFAPSEIEQWKSRSIGRSFDSYRYAGRHWALPLDAASQVAAAREDLLEAAPPRTWEQVLALGARKPVCLSLAGPHAILTLYSISASLGTPPVAQDPSRLLGDGARQAWELLSELYASSFKGWRDRNPIGILDGMSQTGQVAYCPLVFGYVNYAAPSDAAARPIRFVDVPAGPNGLLGSTLGGTGIGISRRAVVSEPLKRHLVDLLSLKVQREFIPFADGQPSAREAWQDHEVNRRWNDFFSGTRSTLERALVRPRHRGYVPFQNEASSLVRDALQAKSPADSVLAALQSLYDRRRPAHAEV